ncbi:hypothetical protein D3C80_1946310 [compost metagenome]
MGENHIEQHHAVLQRVAVETQGIAVLVLQRRVGEPGLGIAGASGRLGGGRHRIGGRRRGCMPFVGHGQGAGEAGAEAQGEPVEKSHG